MIIRTLRSVLGGSENVRLQWTTTCDEWNDMTFLLISMLFTKNQVHVELYRASCLERTTDMFQVSSEKKDDYNIATRLIL